MYYAYNLKYWFILVINIKVIEGEIIMKIKRYILYCLVITALVISVGCKKNDSDKGELEKKIKQMLKILKY